MNPEFTGERLTPDILRLGIGGFYRLAREFGLIPALNSVDLRAKHLQRYNFVIATEMIEGKKVLDVGCGIGYGADILRKNQARSMVGLDIDYPSVAYGHKTYGRKRLEFVQATAELLPFASNSFDVIVCLETIEHLEKPKTFLDEACRILVKEGVLIVSTPNRTITNPGTSIEDPPRNPFHLREYSLEEFRELLGEYFGEVRLYGQEVTKADQENRRWIRGMEKLMNLRRVWEISRVRAFEEAGKELKFLVAVCQSVKQKK